MMLKKTMTLAVLVVLLFSCGTTEKSERPAPPLPEGQLQGISDALLSGDPDKAIKAHEAAYKNAPQDASTKILHARLLVLSQRLDEAKKEIAAVLAIDPKNADALYAQALVTGMEGDKKAEKDLLEKTIAAKEPPAEAYAALGTRYLEDKNYDKAQDLFNQAQSRDKQNLVAAIGLGNVNFKQKKFEEARKYFDQAIAIQPDYPFTYSDRALVKRQLGDLDGALQDLDAAIALEPDYSYNYFDRGRIFMDRNKWDEAIAQFTIAIEKEPDMFAAFVLRAGLYDEMNKIDQALTDYETVLKLRPDYYFAYSQAGTLYLIKNQPAKAFALYAQAFTYDKNTQEFALLAALSLKKAGQKKEAVEYLNKNLSQFTRPSWQYDLAQFYLAPEADNNLAVTNASRETNKVKRAQMLFYLAEQYLLLDKKNLARTYFTEMAGVEKKGMIEKRLAQIELGRLAAQ
jgi:tetratricopeptide (TPR) repeat protein